MSVWARQAPRHLRGRLRVNHRSAFAWLIITTLLATAGGVCADTIPVMRIQNGVPAWVDEEVPEVRVRTLIDRDDTVAAENLRRSFEAMLAQPAPAAAAEGVESFFPVGSVIDDVVVDDGRGTVTFTMPAEYLRGQMTDLDVENITHLAVTIGMNTPELTGLNLRARAEGEREYRRFSDFLPAPPPQLDKPTGDVSVAPAAAGQPNVRGQGQPQGALSGASIFISPGHGWYYSGTLGRWATQRGNTNNIIEDLSNGEAVLEYLVPYLWNAGARVYTTRERDLNPNMVIVDNGGAGYSTTGSWTTASLPDQAYNDDLQRAVTVTGAPTATATFTPTIPADGFYSVYVWYNNAGTGTEASDARFTVNHSGGSTEWTQNLNRDGYTWKFIGSYHFEAGTSGSVVVDNQTGTAGQYVVADAVRFGGGMGDFPDDVSGTTSGEPRWEESGRYYAGYMGKADWASFGTVWALSNWADWECEDSWEGGANDNAIYVAWHTNAPDPGSGTSSFAYTTGDWEDPFEGVAGGDILRDHIHTELINDIRAGWDAGWINRGTHTANFGEINPSQNNDMPAALTEIAFHATPSDAQQLREPNFRRLAARAVYQGIVKFYHDYFYLTEGNSEFNDDTLLPEPPTNLRVVNNGSGGITLNWNAPSSNTGDDLLGDPATGYRVYQSTNGKGFDNGVTVAGTSTTINGLTPGEVYFFRVTATNSGGESFPTETLAARVRTSPGTPILIVNGFDRLDRNMNIVEDDPYDTDDLHRGYLWLMNTYDYIIAHANAIDTFDRDFDSCANESVESGQIDLFDYDTVVWILGEESNADDTFSSTEQAAVTAFLNAGGSIFVSGAEIGYELDGLNQGRSFYENDLHVDYVSDDAGSYAATGATGSIFDGIALTFDNGSSIYDVDFPDVLAANAGSVAALNYSGGGGPTSVEDFDNLTGWEDPNYSGSTTAHADSTFTLAASPTHQGSGSGDIYYRWDTGTRLREYNSAQTQFPTASNLSLWVYGDNSGHEIRISLRDPVDGELFHNPHTTINFTGWQQITWNDIENNNGTYWAGTGDGVISGSNVILDSVEIFKVTAQDTGNIYLDDCTYTPTGGGGGVAAIQYSPAAGQGTVVLGFPFEAITSVTAQNQVMAAALAMFGTPASTDGVPVELSVFTVE